LKFKFLKLHLGTNQKVPHVAPRKPNRKVCARKLGEDRDVSVFWDKRGWSFVPEVCDLLGTINPRWEQVGTKPKGPLAWPPLRTAPRSEREHRAAGAGSLGDRSNFSLHRTPAEINSLFLTSTFSKAYSQLVQCSQNGL